MDRTTEILASNIRRRRKELGLTQSELGEALGYSEKAISKWESGNGLTAARDVILPVFCKMLHGTKTAYTLGVCERPMVYGALLLAGMPESNEKEKKPC